MSQCFHKNGKITTNLSRNTLHHDGLTRFWRPSICWYHDRGQTDKRCLLRRSASTRERKKASWSLGAKVSLLQQNSHHLARNSGNKLRSLFPFRFYLFVHRQRKLQVINFSNWCTVSACMNSHDMKFPKRNLKYSHSRNMCNILLDKKGIIRHTHHLPPNLVGYSKL